MILRVTAVKEHAQNNVTYKQHVIQREQCEKHAGLLSKNISRGNTRLSCSN